MKMIFQLERSDGRPDGMIEIVGKVPENKPYVCIQTEYGDLYIKDKDMKLFAKNLLKAIKP